MNGDGTATDYDTELQWEQKTDDGSVHDKDNTYSWCVGGELPFPYCDNLANPPDGTAFTDFLGTLNNGTSGDGTTTSGCFAGHCDWRLPAIEELAGIVDLAAPGCNPYRFIDPCIDQIVFGPAAEEYWSATSHDTEAAWKGNLYIGQAGYFAKFEPSGVRAVRSGL